MSAEEIDGKIYKIEMSCEKIDSERACIVGYFLLVNGNNVGKRLGC